MAQVGSFNLHFVPNLPIGGRHYGTIMVPGSGWGLAAWAYQVLAVQKKCETDYVQYSTGSFDRYKFT